MKLVTLDFYQLFRRVAADCDLDSSTVRYCLNRLKSEGLKFWTVTLPRLAKCVLYSIEKGYFTFRLSDRDDDLLTDFAWKGRSLRYFRSLLAKIFDLKSGILLESPCASALCNIRQIVEYVYKLATSFDEQTKSNYEEQYEQTQRDVATSARDHTFEQDIRRNAETYYPELFRVQPHEILAYGPRNGSGSFSVQSTLQSLAYRCLGVPFYEWRVMPSAAVGLCDHAFKGFTGYFKPYPGYKFRGPSDRKTVSEGRTAKVLFVPKDSRGPRVISKEPFHIIRAQLAFLSWSYSVVEKITHNRVNFLDQGINRALALEGSITRKWATLDLKEASDRVSFARCLRIFRNSPGISYYLKHCRSTTYQLPLSGRKGRMFALAGMGSGLTFSIMSMLCHLAIVTLVSKTRRLPFKEVAKSVYVYGDDIIVPVEWYDIADQALTRVGLKVNKTKSFVHGPFRESCGGDYLQGKEVSPVRLKLQNCGLPHVNDMKNLKLTSSQCRDPKGLLLRDNLIVALVSHAKELRKSSRIHTAQYIERIVSMSIPMPYVGEGSAVLGIYTEDSDLIRSQVESVEGGIASIRASIRVPVYHRSNRECPYKYLGSFLSNKNSLDAYDSPLVNSDCGRSYGEIPIPRAIRIKTGKVDLESLTPSIKPPVAGVLMLKAWGVYDV